MISCYFTILINLRKKLISKRPPSRDSVPKKDCFFRNRFLFFRESWINNLENISDEEIAWR